NQQLSGDKSEMILYMPQSLVIHIEPHKSIPDEYKAVIVFADGDIKRFSVPVMKYWTFTDEELINKNLFPLLPLRIYLLRETLDTLTKSGDGQAKQAAVIKARDIAETVAREAAELNKAGLLTGEDYKKVLSAVANLFIHLNDRYSGDKSLNERVKTMVELDFSEEHLTVLIRENKAIEIAKKLLKKGLSIEDIADSTELDINTIEELKEHLEQEAENNDE
ncbi:MAG: hypothetical protein LBR74_00730, partial [Eubacterium sp.]|nr:hypothetical protein [Eubacterium sp.]